MLNIVTAVLLITLPCSPSVAAAARGQDDDVIDRFIAGQASREGGEEYGGARKVVAGDLNRDGVPDLAVLYTVEGQHGSNNYVQYLAVFIRARGTLVPVGHTVVGGKSRRGVELKSVRGNTIFLKTLSYGPKDASCCPSRRGVTRYVLVSRRLKEL